MLTLKIIFVERCVYDSTRIRQSFCWPGWEWVLGCLVLNVSNGYPFLQVFKESVILTMDELYSPSRRPEAYGRLCVSLSVRKASSFPGRPVSRNPHSLHAHASKFAGERSVARETFKQHPAYHPDSPSFFCCLLSRHPSLAGTARVRKH